MYTLHLECKNSFRQKVSLAAELLSNSVSKALLLCHKDESEAAEQKSARENLSKFIEIVNNWFDVMNSYTRDDSLPLKSAYGNSMYIAKQNDALDKMYNMMLNSRCVGKRGIQKFQRGILMSINSMKQLFLHLKEKWKISYIMTHKLNQDALENLCAQLRVKGGANDHPTPIDLLNRLRMLILGKPMPLWSMNASTNTI